MPEKIDFPPTPVEQVFNSSELREALGFVSAESVEIKKFNEFDGREYVTSLANGENNFEIKSGMPLPFMLDFSKGQGAGLQSFRDGLGKLLKEVEAHNNGS